MKHKIKANKIEHSKTGNRNQDMEVENTGGKPSPQQTGNREKAETITELLLTPRVQHKTSFFYSLLRLVLFSVPVALCRLLANSCRYRRVVRLKQLL